MRACAPSPLRSPPPTRPHCFFLVWFYFFCSYAAGALANLALDEGSRAQMVADGAVAPLVKLCSKSQDKRVLVRSAARRRSPPPPLAAAAAPPNRRRQTAVPSR